MTPKSAILSNIYL